MPALILLFDIFPGKALENKTDLLFWCFVQPCLIIDQTCNPRAFVTDHAACDRDIQREDLFGHAHPACVERLIRLSAETRVFADKLPFDSCAIQVDLPDRGEIPSQKHRAFGGQVRQVQGHMVFYFAICLFFGAVKPPIRTIQVANAGGVQIHHPIGDEPTVQKISDPVLRS